MKIQKAINSLFRPIKLNFLHNLLRLWRQPNLLKKNLLRRKFFFQGVIFTFYKSFLQYETEKSRFHLLWLLQMIVIFIYLLFTEVIIENVMLKMPDLVNYGNRARFLFAGNTEEKSFWQHWEHWDNWTHLR